MIKMMMMMMMKKKEEDEKRELCGAVLRTRAPPKFGIRIMKERGGGREIPQVY